MSEQGLSLRAAQFSPRTATNTIPNPSLSELSCTPRLAVIIVLLYHYRYFLTPVDEYQLLILPIFAVCGCGKYSPVVEWEGGGRRGLVLFIREDDW